MAPLWISCDPARCMLTPERSIQIQRSIGADIMMQVWKNISVVWLELLFVKLDDVVDSRHEDKDRFEEARHRTVRWLDRWVLVLRLALACQVNLFCKVSLCSPSAWLAKPVSNSAGWTGRGEEEGLCWPGKTLLASTFHYSITALSPNWDNSLFQHLNIPSLTSLSLPDS